MDSPFSEPQAGAHLRAALTWSAGAPRFVNQKIEQKYRADEVAQAGFTNRVGIVALITIFNLFFFTEFKLSPEVMTLSAWLRFGVLAPFTVLFLVSDWRGWLGRWRTQSAMMLALATTFTAALEWRQVTSTNAIPNIEAAALLQLGALGLRLTLRQTQIFVALSCMIYITGISFSPCISSLALPSLVLTDLAIGIAIMVFTTRVDVRDRRVFLLMLQAEEGRALLAAQNVALDGLLHLDVLTGLGNRRCFDQALATAWAHAEASRLPLGLVMFDIDHFKPFNDRLGHRAGDECLRALGAAVNACVREPGDTLARYGGEEFALILPGATLADAAAAAERIRRAIVDLAIPHPASTHTGCVTVSLGVACAIPGSGAPGTMSVASPGALVEAADRCLYAAKRCGRNRLATDYRPPAEEAWARERTA
jgi:diguanylate cyclase (GGDEF)-like protein